jgi:hypothetical protein
MKTHIIMWTGLAILGIAELAIIYAIHNTI